MTLTIEGLAVDVKVFFRGVPEPIAHHMTGLRHGAVDAINFASQNLSTISSKSLNSRHADDSIIVNCSKQSANNQFMTVSIAPFVGHYSPESIWPRRRSDCSSHRNSCLTGINRGSRLSSVNLRQVAINVLLCQHTERNVLARAEGRGRGGLFSDTINWLSTRQPRRNGR